MDLTVLGPPPPHRPGEIRVCAMVRDEAVRLPSFLRHHRALGADRFIIVDDGSTDGTVELLAAQPDVHVVRSSAGFADRHGPVDWISHVLDAFCDGYWTLTVDADELFVFPGCERIGLRAACEHFDAVGAEGVMALMIDMYGPGEVSATAHDPDARLLDTCPYFDPGPYRAVRTGLFPNVHFHGGPRMRLFDFSPYQERPPVLTKAPLVKWERGRQYLLSTHAVTPLRLYPMLAGLLHFKFLSDFHDRAIQAVATGRHYGGSSEYRAYKDVMDRGGALRPRDDHSVRYLGTDQLVRLELMYADAAFDALVAGRAAAQA
ncbi:MAG: glycosyltransferase family 2 protein [Pseudomonadota bacterium]